MKKYEVMYILRSDLDNDSVKAEVEAVNKLFTNNGANVLETKEWGLRELAYEIAGNKKGYYVWMLVEAGKEAVAEFNRVSNISEKIIRQIVVVDGE